MLGLTGFVVVMDLAARVVLAVSIGGGGGPIGTALVAAGFACLAALLPRRTLVGAFIAAAAATALEALDLVGLAQAVRVLDGLDAWRPWLGIALLALGLAASVAASAVTIGAGGPDRAAGLARVIAWSGLVLVIAAGGWAFVSPSGLGADGHPEPGGLRLAGRASLAYAAGAIALATWFAVRRPIARAWAAAGPARVQAAPLRGPDRVARFARALADELFRSTRHRAADEERARLAAEIHASLLPGLRQAAIAARDPRVPPSLAKGLRAAVSDAETLMESRQSVVLEQFGLVAALEALAERVEAQHAIEVVLDLDRAVDPDAVPDGVARSVFRIALLAVDNAGRHARASRIVIELAADGAGGRLRVADDGVGLDATRAPASAVDLHAGRGLRDMAAEADAMGATLAVSRADPGTTVDLSWQSSGNAGNHARRARPIPDGGGAGAA